MFHKLNQFVCVDVCSGTNLLRVSGFLLEVDPDFITMTTYDEDGVKDCESTFPMDIVMALYVGYRDERELSLKVSWALDSVKGKVNG